MLTVCDEPVHVTRSIRHVCVEAEVRGNGGGGEQWRWWWATAVVGTSIYATLCFILSRSRDPLITVYYAARHTPRRTCRS